MKKVAVIGGGGFLGSAIINELANRYQLSVFVREESNVSRLSNTRALFDLHRVRDEVMARAVIEDKPDIVIYCAVKYEIPKDQSGVDTTNVTLPVTIASSLRSSGGIFVHFDSFYSKFPHYRHLQAYQQSKHACLVKLQSLGEEIKVINARLEQVYGPNDNQEKSIASLIAKICSGAATLKLSPGEQRRDFIYVADVARAVHVLLREADRLKKGMNTVEVGSGMNYSLKDFLLLVKELSSSRVKLEFGVLPYREGEPMDSKADVVLLKALGWSPKISLEEGLKLTIQSSIEGS